uniref:Uncharacterized protein n=1 Tax=Salix viminalis TaxID=40686 RepID=A0A6N2MXM4_SALVM
MFTKLTCTKFNSCSLYKRDTLAGDFHTSTKVSNTASEVATLGIVGKFALSAGGATRLSSPNKAGGGVEELDDISTSDFGRNSGKALASIFWGDLASSSLKASSIIL